MWWLALALAVLGLWVAYRWPVVLRFSLAVGPGARGELEAAVMAGRLRVAMGWDSAAFSGTAEMRFLHVVRVRRVVVGSALRDALLWLLSEEIVSQVIEKRLDVRPGSDEQQPPAPPGGARAAPRVSLGALRTAAAAGGRRFWPHLQVEELDLALRVGMGDAAATAVACGCGWAAVGFGTAWLAQRVQLLQPPRAQLTPSFTATGFTGRVSVRARIAQGEVLLALAAAAWGYVTEIFRFRRGRAT